jgi:hypothetical protein
MLVYALDYGCCNQVADTIMKANGAIRIPAVACRISPKRTLTALGTVMGLLILSLGAVSQAQTNITPAQYLAGQPKPNFAAGHHLPHLTMWAWGLSSNATVECALNWGYTLDLGDADSNTVAQINTTNSTKWEFIQLAKNNPAHYALSINTTRNWPTNLSRGFWVTNSAGYFVDDNTNLTINWTSSDIVSPEAADSDLTLEAVFQTAAIKAIVSNAPIAMILNGGERDLGVCGFDTKAWKFDPRVQVSAVYTNAYKNGNFPSSATNGESWPDYISQRKAHQQSFLLSAVKSAAPNRELYIFYNTGNEQNRFVIPGEGWWEDTWANWGWNSLYMNTHATDLPSFEDYYTGGNSWTNATGDQWNQISDLLTHHLNGVGYNLSIGYTNNDYSWMCGGWSNTDTNRLADISRYTGFLKCLYTAGTIGGVAGYFDYPTNTIPGSIFGGPGFDASFPSNSPPHWLLQIMALSHVHALFSHLDNFLYNGDLLSGPQYHVWSRDQPAYEFTNTAADATARVLVRKLRGTNQWIVTAWAADGTNRNVTVIIPPFGALTVLAANSGSVYQVTMSGTNVQQTLLDEYTSFPATPPLLLTGAVKLPNGAFQFAFTNTPAVTNYITTNITATITTNWSTRGPPRITGYTTNITTTLATNTSENTVTVLTTTNLLLPLTNWTVLGTVTDSPPGQFQFTDPQAANRPMRFYRVRSP